MIIYIEPFKINMVLLKSHPVGLPCYPTGEFYVFSDRKYIKNTKCICMAMMRLIAKTT